MLTALNTAAVEAFQIVGFAAVYPAGQVPDKPATPYAVVAVGVGAPRGYRLAAAHGNQVHRISVQCFGATYNECAFVVDKADAALLDVALEAPAYETSRCRRELATEIRRDPDGEVLMYALLTYTFTATPA